MTGVSVVGGGLIGLATALRLADRGHAVTLLDPAPASGATHHAGGMLAPAAEVVYRQESLFPLMQRSAELYPGLIQAVEKHTDLPTGYRTEGTLVVAADRADSTHLAELSDYQSAHGMDVERLPLRQARKLEPSLSPQLAGAVLIPGDHQVNPRMFAAALLDALANLGVSIVREKVTELPGDEQVVLANGLGAAALHEGLQLRPVYGDILRLGVPDHLSPLITRVVRGFVADRPVYLIPRSDGTLAIGATSREDDRPVPRTSAIHDLLGDAIRLVPGVEECDFLEATTGARPGTPDDLPYLGRVSGNLIISTGYFRHGILLTALAADATLALVEGRDPGIDLAACDPHRHQEF
ncbi:glycine oxidase ThiO [Corynebacterium comes]|uniref:glycine oxidase n=1 Tax=Corynebacterium comes TaxID=2675218 RepID=A0A6B8VLG2_9CORY|nr:glycine oxidase ThiO [Corynebacterium comes]QGU04913.1 Hydrogen cyanide synthase subunit HcnC precursor [Corynebacterium comes]